MSTLELHPPQRRRTLIVLGFLWAVTFLAHFGIAGATLDWDMFHEMALARDIIATGHVPLHDTFAYTPTVVPVIHHEWGMGMLLYPIAEASGLVGIYLLLIALVTGIVTTCVAVARERGASWPTIILAMVVAGPLGIVGYGAVRAQFFTVLFMALLLFMIEADRRKGRAWMIVWPVLYVAWVNIHGGFLVGLGVLGLYWLESAARAKSLQPRLLMLLLITVALSGVSPYGYGHLTSVIRGAMMPRANVEEWNPLWKDATRSTAFLISLVPLIYAVRHIGWRRAVGLPLILACALLGVRHLRHSGLYAVAWFCYVPAWMSATPAGRWFEAFWQRRARVLAAIFFLLAGFGALRMILDHEIQLYVPTRAADAQGHNVIYPVGAAEYLQDEHFAGNVMTPFEMGSFLSWKLAPGVKVSIDSRYEVAYPPELAKEILSFYQAAEGWRQTLDRYPTDLVLTRNSAKVAGLLGPEAGWHRVYVDDVYSIYARPGIELPVVDRTGQPLVMRFP